MNIVNHIVSTIMNYHIPLQVLEITFAREIRLYRGDKRVAIENAIKNHVIYGKVLEDCNLLGGKIVQVLIKKEWINDNVQKGTWVINIPMEATDNRSIMTARSLFVNESRIPIGSRPNAMGLPYNTLAIAKSTQPHMLMTAILDRSMFHNLRQTTMLEVIGNNLILCTEPPTYPNESILECVLEYNRDLSDISKRAVIVMTEACSLALKAYIYNNINIELDQGALDRGHTLDSIKDTVSDYSSALDDYREKLMELNRSLKLADKNRTKNYINSVIGGYI